MQDKNQNFRNYTIKPKYSKSNYKKQKFRNCTMKTKIFEIVL